MIAELKRRVEDNDIFGSADMRQVLVELDAKEEMITALQEQMARLAEQHAKVLASAVAEAREEQREADAEFAHAHFGAGEAADLRSAPLHSTPLAARIAELEAMRDRNIWVIDSGTVHDLKAALAAEVERHQATAKERDEARDLVAQFEAGLTRGAALPAATLIDRARRFLASLPAGPREDR